MNIGTTSRIHFDGTMENTINTSNGRLRKGEVYIGDRNIRNQDKVTIQIHRLNLTDVNGNAILDDDGNVIYNDLISVAIWIPETIGKDIIRQPDNI